MTSQQLPGVPPTQNTSWWPSSDNTVESKDVWVHCNASMDTTLPFLTLTQQWNSSRFHCWEACGFWMFRHTVKFFETSTRVSFMLGGKGGGQMFQRKSSMKNWKGLSSGVNSTFPSPQTPQGAFHQSENQSFWCFSSSPFRQFHAISGNSVTWFCLTGTKEKEGRQATCQILLDLGAAHAAPEGENRYHACVHLYRGANGRC